MLGSNCLLETTFNTHSGRPMNWLAKAFRAEATGAWLRFVLAILGLGLAFVAAVFSTASREAGNVPATIILASLALLLATGVGLGTVPTLRVELRREGFATLLTSK